MSLLRIPVTATFMPEWVRRAAEAINALIAGRNTLDSYTVSSLPTATKAGQLIFVTDETGGPTPAYWNGTNWKRVADGATVS